MAHVTLLGDTLDSFVPVFQMLASKTETLFFQFCTFSGIMYIIVVAVADDCRKRSNFHSGHEGLSSNLAMVRGHGTQLKRSPFSRLLNTYLRGHTAPVEVGIME